MDFAMSGNLGITGCIFLLFEPIVYSESKHSFVIYK